MRLRLLIPVFGLWLLAAAQHFWIAPHLLQLPADYADETRYATKSRLRGTPDGDWEEADLIGRRVDQTLVAAAEHSIIQGSLHWTTADGLAAFESSGIYGVDRQTRMNLPGYGDSRRDGQFLFPPHTEARTYRYWDPQFIGARMASFAHSDALEGLPVYLFHFRVQGLDESAGFAHLPDVPERYRAHTEGEGTLWVEPTSGLVVDYEERGTSYFVEPGTGKRIADLYVWSDSYTPQTKAAKLRQGAAARRRIQLLELGLPLGLLFAGCACLVFGLLRRRAPTPGADDLESPAGDQP